ncbi:glycosyltransferase family 2 protein [Peribacillus butanolivorans]|uniref:glycosyltransferase family 2 protein n=1 Tax=Peribacillus butanolivorans TaxID=421767 RepID=UPI0013C31E7E|nr:glycosyltransferase family A protein [Peribacillus butanolivorans]
MQFTVVIPLYNKEKHIIRAIKSVLQQTHNDFEIIVVNDGSIDSSVEQVKKIGDSKIKLIQQKNAGVSAARNNGINNANFNYIAFLDADDTWEPDFLETINKLINSYPMAGAYATSYRFVKENGKVVPARDSIFFNGKTGGIVDYFKESLKTPLISASSVVIPKSVFENLGGFPIGITRGEDLDMWCRIALNYEVVFSNSICANYFQNAENRACNTEREHTKSLMSYAEKILIREKEKSSSLPDFFEEYMIKIIIHNATYLSSINRHKEARKLLYKYRYTKYNKKNLIKSYVLNYKLMYSIKKTLKNKLK